LVNAIKQIHLNSDREIKIFNMSFEMGFLQNNEISKLAASLDDLMHEYDILCVIAA
jgi:hypothetical protein